MPSLTRRATLAAMLAAGSAAFARQASAADRVVGMSFLLVNDVYRISPNKEGRGGMAKLGAVVKAERAKALSENRRLFCVHAGDTLSPSLLSGLDEGAHMIDLFNHISLDAFAPGNHEFDCGKDAYVQRVSEARFPFLAANMRDGANQKLPGHEDRLLIDVDGLKVALIGLAYDLSALVSRPGALIFRSTRAIAPEAAKAARAEGADFVVAIIHADKETGAHLMNTHCADLILSGHNHDLHIDFDGRTALLESQQDANFINVVDIDAALGKDEAGRPLISWQPNVRVIDTAKVAPDPVMQGRVAVYEARLAQAFEVEIATLKTPLDSRTETVRTQECAIGNLVADAVLQGARAEAALVNGGGIRGNRVYRAGEALTKRDIFDELPFGNKTVVTRVSGRSLLAALENGLSQLDRPAGRFPQIAGLSVIADRSAPAGSRVIFVKVNGEELDRARIYRLATNDFLALGGDGYAMLASPVPATADSGTRLVAQDVMDHVEAMKVVEARVEGRIVLR